MDKPLNPLITKYFKNYCIFFNTDLESAILDGRNFIIIDIFRISLSYIISNDIKAKDISDLVKDLQMMVKDEVDIYSLINITKCDFYSVITIREVFVKSLSYFKDYFLAYDLLYDVFIAEGGDEFEPLEDRKFQDILVEFNNALSHLLTSFTHDKNSLVVEANIDKANTHLYRGTLDAYKEIISKNSMVIENNQHKKIENKTFKKFYIELRELEANNIGKTENEKRVLVKHYRALAWALIN
jgi:hypothetical protein